MKPLRVLLVEDEMLIAMLFTQVLEEMATMSAPPRVQSFRSRRRSPMPPGHDHCRCEAAGGKRRLGHGENPPYGARAARVRQWRCFRC